MKFNLVAFLILLTMLLTSCVNINVELLQERDKGIGERLKVSKSSKKEKAKTEEQDDENLLLSRNLAQLREINIFLSNFSETDYNPKSRFYSEEEAKINFAYLHASINSHNLVFHKGNYMGISAKDVDNILYRFFGKTVKHKTPKNNRCWTYTNGEFLAPAADGESYSEFSIATEMTKRADGNFDVMFNIYSDPSVTGGDIITDKSVYLLSVSDAEKNYDYRGCGTAVLKEKVHNGENTYELISYDVIYN